MVLTEARLLIKPAGKAADLLTRQRDVRRCISNRDSHLIPIPEPSQGRPSIIPYSGLHCRWPG